MIPQTESPPEVVAHPAEFETLEPRAATAAATTLQSLRDVPITIEAQLGRATMPISEILKLGPGAVVELEESINQPVELTVRGVAFATGEVVVVDGHFAELLRRPARCRHETGEERLHF